MGLTVYTVGQLNKYVKNMFAQDYLLQSIQVSGEISNCKYHSSGHIYFTLKDDVGAVACVMFAGNAVRLPFRLTDGLKVVCTGKVEIYERDGKYQLYPRTIEKVGAGALYQELERLKKELEELGMFAKEYKRPIPPFVKTLGVVTAPTGAVIRDIITVSGRRNPYVQIILYPALVQGSEAAPTIVSGIRTLERMGVDAIIIGRGGGSIEDLWPFNERIVAEAIFDCSVPIISAVGHETDFTIADFVADLRAATPSAAAEMAVGEISVHLERLRSSRDLLLKEMLGKIRMERANIDQAARSLRLMSPMAKIASGRQDIMYYEERLEQLMMQKLERNKSRLALLIERMKALSPLEKLSSGYSYVEDAEGGNLRSVKGIRVGDSLRIHMTDGMVEAAVTKILTEES